MEEFVFILHKTDLKQGSSINGLFSDCQKFLPYNNKKLLQYVGYAGVHSVDPGVDAAGFQATQPSASGCHDKASYVSK